MKHTLWGIFVAASLWGGAAVAESLQVQVLDRDGQPVSDAVVVAYPQGASAALAAPTPASATIEQERMRFVPAVTVIAPGSTVRFLNQDRWDHHVRAIPTDAAHPAAGGDASSTGVEFRMAARVDGKAPSQSDVTFSKAGVVLLGCHLHSSMVGHIFVTDSAWTIKTEADGVAKLTGLPSGPVQLRVWHAQQIVDLPRKTVQLSPGNDGATEVVKLSIVPKRRRAS